MLLSPVVIASNDILPICDDCKVFYAYSLFLGLSAMLEGRQYINPPHFYFKLFEKDFKRLPKIGRLHSHTHNQLMVKGVGKLTNTLTYKHSNLVLKDCPELFFLFVRVYRGEAPKGSGSGVWFVAGGGVSTVKNVEAYEMGTIWALESDQPVQEAVVPE